MKRALNWILFLMHLSKKRFYLLKIWTKLKSFKVTTSKHTFIKIMLAKAVNDYSKFEKFVDCLKSEKSFREFENNTFDKYCDLHKAIAYIVERKSPTKGKNYAISTSIASSKILSPRQSLSAEFESVHTEGSFYSILDHYLYHLQSTYSTLPAVSLQGWHDRETHTRNLQILQL